MGEKDVPLVVFFFGVVIFVLIGSYILIMHYDSTSMNSKKITNNSYSYFYSEKPLAQYIGSYYSKYVKRKTPTMRDIKSLIHSPQESKPPASSIVHSETQEVLIQNDNTVYTKKDNPKGDKIKKETSVTKSDPFSPPEKKKKTERNRPKEEKTISAVPRKPQKRSEIEHGESRETKSLSSTAFFVVVTLPAFVLIAVGIGLVATRAWSDLVNNQKANNEFLDIKGKAGVVDIESGLGSQESYDEKSVVSSCMEGCALVSRVPGKSKTTRKRTSKKRKKSRPSERKTVRFGNIRVVGDIEEQFTSLLNTTNPMISYQHDRKKGDKRKKQKPRRVKSPKEKPPVSLEEILRWNT